MSTLTAKLERLAKQKNKIREEEKALRKQQADNEQKDQKRREAVIGKVLIEKAKKGSTEHQALLISMVENDLPEKDKPVFKPLMESLGAIETITPPAEEPADKTQEKISDNSEELNDPLTANPATAIPPL